MLLIAVACYLFLPALAMAPQEGGTAHYLYDENGRLKAVLLSNGEASIYNYDAAGNLVSITTQLASVLSIIDFAPRSGSVGSTVTIYGTGFSVNANENAVSFNGVTATVNSSTSTEIVTSVPAGATTGAISIASPLGSTTSTTEFGVLTPPTITAINPLAGSIGSAVTITGSNFEIFPGHTEVKFNGVPAEINSVTLTGIVANVPSSSSGRISVTTSAGTAISSQDFFVSPNDIVNVTQTGRLAFGEPKFVALSGPGQAALFVFDGLAGQRVSLNLFNASFNFRADVTIYSSDGSEVGASSSIDSDSRSAFIDAVNLPETGTYSVLIDTSSYINSSGNAVVQLFNVPPDASGTIEIDGAATTIANTVPGQNARLSFTAEAGQRVRVTGNVTQSQRSAYLSVLSPDGSLMVNPQLMSNTYYGQQPAFISNLLLPTSGTYTILVDPSRADITGANIILSGPPGDITLNIAPGDPAVNLNPEVGQNARLTFNGTEGQRISLDVFNAAYTLDADVSISGPNGVQLLQPTHLDYTYRGIFIEPLTLPDTGTYTILLDTTTRYSNSRGTVSMRLYDVPPDATGTIELGQQVVIANTVPGQNGRLSFTGTAGQTINIVGEITAGGGSGYLSVYRPDGVQMNYPEFMYPGSFFGHRIAFLDRLTVPVDGTYSILIDPSRADINSTTVTLSLPPEDVVESITPGGPPVTVSTTLGQNARLTFEGTAGQRVSLTIGNVSIGVSKVSIVHPDGWTMVYDYIYNGGSVRFFDTLTLPMTGTYTIYVDPLQSDTGQMTLTLNDVPPDASGSLTIGGPPSTLDITTPGQNGQMTFEGTADQHVSLNITDVTISNSNVSIFNPDGSYLIYGTYVSFNGILISNLTLPADGTYRIVVDPYGPPTGSMTMTVYESNAPELTGTITTDGTPLDLNFERPEQNARITFAGAAGQTLNLVLSNVTVPHSSVSLLLPNGTVIFGPTSVSPPGDTLTFENLPADSTYTILIDPAQAYTGSMTLSLSPVVDATGTVEIGGAPVTITTSQAQNARLTVNGQAGQRLFLKFSGVTTLQSYVSVLSPDGTTLVDNVYLGTGGAAIDIQTLPATGAYTILIDPGSTFSGQMTIQATETGEISSFGLDITVVIPASQPQGATLTFNGTAGSRMGLFVSSNTIAAGTLSLYKPDGTLLRSSSLNSISNVLLPADGTYSIKIVPDNGSAGHITLTMGGGGGGSGATD
jgi:YD repeat-containing protein